MKKNITKQKIYIFEKMNNKIKVKAKKMNKNW